MIFNQNYWFIFYILKEKKNKKITFIFIPFIFGFFIQKIILTNIFQKFSEFDFKHNNFDLKNFFDSHFIRFDYFFNFKLILKKKNKTNLFWIKNKVLYNKFKFYKGWKKNKKAYRFNYIIPAIKLNHYILKTNSLSKYITNLMGIDLIGKFCYNPKLLIYRLSQKIYNYNLKFNDPYFINILKKKKDNSLYNKEFLLKYDKSVILRKILKNESNFLKFYFKNAQIIFDFLYNENIERHCNEKKKIFKLIYLKKNKKIKKSVKLYKRFFYFFNNILLHKWDVKKKIIDYFFLLYNLPKLNYIKPSYLKKDKYIKVLKKRKKKNFSYTLCILRKFLLINKVIRNYNKFLINYNFLFSLIKNLSLKLYINILFFSINLGVSCNFFSFKFFIAKLINKKKYNLNNISDYLYGLFLEINKLPVVLFSYYHLLLLNDNMSFNNIQNKNIYLYLRSNPIYNFIIKRKSFIFRCLSDFSFFIKLSFIKLLSIKFNLYSLKKNKKHIYSIYNIRRYKKRFKFNIKKIKFNFYKIVNNFIFWILITFLFEYLYYTKLFFICWLNLGYFYFKNINNLFLYSTTLKNISFYNYIQETLAKNLTPILYFYFFKIIQSF